MLHPSLSLRVKLCKMIATHPYMHSGCNDVNHNVKEPVAQMMSRIGLPYKNPMLCDMYSVKKKKNILCIRNAKNHVCVVFENMHDVHTIY